MKTRVPPPVLLIVTGIIMWLVAHSNLALPIYIPYSLTIAVLLAGLGLLVDLLSLRQFRRAQTTVNPLSPEKASSLVREGVFSRSRNPMYVGLVLILSGWAIWLSALSNLVVLFLFVLVITAWQIKPEEVALRSLFGKDYDDYCRSVRRWI